MPPDARRPDSVVAGARAKPGTLGNKITNVAKRRAGAALAKACNEVMPDAEVAWWLREVMAGRDPDAPTDADGSPRLRSLESIQAAAPDWGTRMRAARMFLERKDGLPAQHVHIQQELKAELTTARVTLTPAAIATMDPSKKQALRDLLREAISVGSTPVLAMGGAQTRAVPETIAVESAEVI